MKKQAFTGIVAIGLLAGTSTSMGAAPLFPDIESHWAKPSILHLQEAGLIAGMEDGTFQPQGPITREQILKMILLAVKATLLPQSPASFTDVPTDHWSHTYIETALQLSLIEKGAAGTFDPGKVATRAEVAEWITRAIPPMNTGIAGGMKASFSDTKGLPESTQLAISQVYHLGVMLGDGGMFRPYDPLTRAEAAVLIERLVERIESSREGQWMAFKPVKAETANETVRVWIESLLKEPGLHTKALNGKMYILYAMGEKRTGGYSVTISKVLETSNQITVHVTEKSPQPGQMVTQVLTYPYASIEIPATAKPIVVQVTKQ